MLWLRQLFKHAQTGGVVVLTVEGVLAAGYKEYPDRLCGAERSFAKVFWGNPDRGEAPGHKYQISLRYYRHQPQSGPSHEAWGGWAQFNTHSPDESLFPVVNVEMFVRDHHSVADVESFYDMMFHATGGVYYERNGS